MLKRYNIAATKSKSVWEEILHKSLCGSVPAEKLGHVEENCVTSFYMVGSFYCPGYIVDLSTFPVQFQ